MLKVKIISKLKGEQEEKGNRKDKRFQEILNSDTTIKNMKLTG